MLHASDENAASCFLLDVLDQLDSCGGSKPWASASISHLRALAPIWRTSTPTSHANIHWAAFLMAEALRTTIHRKPFLFTLGDQLLLAGPEPPSADTLLASLEVRSGKSAIAILSQSMYPYIFHITCLARRLWDTLTGDHARLIPVTEVAVIQFLGSLTVMHAILSRLLEHVDAALSPPITQLSSQLEDLDGPVRRGGWGIGVGFAVLVLRLHHELEYRALSTEGSAHTQERFNLLRVQTRQMAATGAREFARAIRYLPPIHYAEISWTILRDYAQFELDEAESAPVVSRDRVRDLETIAAEMASVGFSVDLVSAPQDVALLNRLDNYLWSAVQVPALLDPILGNMFPALDQGWLDTASNGGLLRGGSLGF
ncbi:hypothetical protein B0H17DRAFT_465505 [Mycena rosella]|uniref:Uncharacterized protein n=1 Tax=Mycena rosella TaxID=1033263 RepID=A0AAD7GGV5_MYCRO|nr:hypothetical protein B0H17DRAFT_465505 [Mycena rosella]